MRKFIKYIIIFLCPVLFGLISLEYLLRKIPNDYSYKYNYLNKNSDKIEVLILGNSHTCTGINPKYIKLKSFNAAHVAQSLNYDFAILEKYNNNWKNLKYIIIPVDYSSMYKSLETGLQGIRIKNYNIYYDIHKSNSCWNNFEIPNGRLIYNLSRVINKKSEISCDSLGFYIATNSILNKNKDLNESGIDAAKRHTANIKDNLLFYENKKTIESIIEFSKAHNAKIVFITCPAHKSYIKNLEQKQLNTTLETIRKISSKNKNTSYYNFLYDSSFLDNDFLDPDHLNENGAKKLTIKIDSIINTN